MKWELRSRVALWAMGAAFHWRPQNCFSKVAPRTDSMGITWDLVRNANSQVPTPSLLMGSLLWLWAQPSLFFKTCRWFFGAPKFENLWYRTCHRIAPWEVVGWWSWRVCPSSLFSYWLRLLGDLDSLAFGLPWAQSEQGPLVLHKVLSRRSWNTRVLQVACCQCTQELSTTSAGHLKRLAEGLWGRAAIESAVLKIQ